jgi:hypothetical protein
MTWDVPGAPSERCCFRTKQTQLHNFMTEAKWELVNLFTAASCKCGQGLFKRE